MAGGDSSGKGPETQQNLTNTLPKELPASFLKKITNDFSPDREIGTSIFGKVYKGILPEGGVIAVKKLAENSPLPRDRTFGNEVTNLMALQHKNIIEFVGFCHEAKKDVVNHNGRYVIVDIMESFLGYKYLPNGSLDKHLYAEPNVLGWDKRFEIIKGICDGLKFLHKKPDGPLIHMNILPTSIWLDEKWVPKIADFGLSRLIGQEQTRINTINVMGPNGYMAPEYLYRGEISTMSDIYSLGMLIIEITTKEKNCPNHEDRSAREFVNKVREKWMEDDHITSKYTSLNPHGLQEVRLCIEIGLKCVEVDRSRRPSIEYIVNKLNGRRV